MNDPKMEPRTNQTQFLANQFPNPNEDYLGFQENSQERILMNGELIPIYASEVLDMLRAGRAVECYHPTQTQGSWQLICNTTPFRNLEDRVKREEYWAKWLKEWKFRAGPKNLFPCVDDTWENVSYEEIPQPEPIGF